MASLQGKSILITGGASGIGREAAILAGKRGALVTVADRDEAGGMETVRIIAEGTGKAQFVAVDIAQEASVASMVDAAVAAYGRLDGAFNNAAVAHSAVILHELSAEDYLRVVGINQVGTFFCMKHEIGAMLKTGGGAIVNTSSAAGLTAYPNAADYVSAKHGVVGLTKAGAVDYGTRGIRVNAVLPGGTMSPMLRKAIDKEPELEGYLIGLQPIGRLGQPIESASAALWLLSDEASFVTGASLSVDGGYTAA